MGVAVDDAFAARAEDDVVSVWPEPGSCSLCDVPLGTPTRVFDDGRALIRCAACDLIHLGPRPGRTSVEAGQLTSLADFHVAMLPHRARFAASHQRVLDRIERHHPQRGALLEIGSAFGWFLDAAHARGWRTTGIEPAHSTPGLRSLHADACTHACAVEDAPRAGPWDAVVLVQVIEHLDDPRRVLQHLVDDLAPGGVVFLETPNAAGLSARLKRPGWEALNLGRGHWHLFDADTLGALCAAVGLEVVDRSTYFKGLTLPRGARALALANRVLDLLALGNNVSVVARKPGSR